jgi:phosphohistidine phosphatase
MDLILWRHSEAHDAEPGQVDMQRPLTVRGEKHAARMAQWLERQLPEGARIFSSPALRAEQTVRALGRKYKIRDALSPGALVEDLLETAGWPAARNPVVLVGHQPILGLVAARLLQMGEGPCPIRKGAIWWLRSRQRDGLAQTVIMSVTAPDRL